MSRVAGALALVLAVSVTIGLVVYAGLFATWVTLTAWWSA